MHCCTGNAIRALYYVWDGMLEHEKDELKVHLLLNRASRWADIDSHVPYTGQVDVKVKQALRRVSIRLPDWAEPSDATGQVDGALQPLDWKGRYCSVDGLRPGQKLSVMFPIRVTDRRVWVEKESLTYTFKGNDVIGVDPPGLNGPIYRREHYRENATRWRKATRAVPERDFRW